MQFVILKYFVLTRACMSNKIVQHAFFITYCGNERAIRVGTFKVQALARVALRVFIMMFLAR